MRVYDLYFNEAIEPIKEIVDACNGIVGKSVDEYLNIVREDDDATNWDDDTELLAETLEKNSEGSIFNWNITPEGNGNPVDWYLHSATVNNDGEIYFNLDESTIDGKFGPATFMKIMEKTVEHESIHIKQRQIMGHELFNSISSGFMRGTKIFEETGNKQLLMNEYFSDPMEIMAHGHDLAVEIFCLNRDTNIILENAIKHIKMLPTLHKHVTQGFPVEHMVTKKMLEYAKEYLRRMK